MPGLAKLVLGVIALFVIVNSQTCNRQPTPTANAAPSRAMSAPALPVQSESSEIAEVRLEQCRAKLKQAQQLDLLQDMKFDKGIPKVWIGPTWYTLGNRVTPKRIGLVCKPSSDYSPTLPQK